MDLIPDQKCTRLSRLINRHIKKYLLLPYIDKDLLRAYFKLNDIFSVTLHSGDAVLQMNGFCKGQKSIFFVKGNV